MQYCVRFKNFIIYFTSRDFKTEKKDHNSESVCVFVFDCNIFHMKPDRLVDSV